MEEKISVIIPVYNVEAYLSKCVDSVLNQSYQNFEVILVDDGSKDQSGGICDAYAKKDARVKVIHKQNEGLSSARNKGLDHATGNYYYFLDSDDYIAEDTLELLLGAIRRTGSDLALCNIQYVDEQGTVLSRQNAFKEYGVRDGTWTKKEFWRHYMGFGHIVCVVACNKLYKKELFAQQRYPEGKIREDEFVVHHVVDQCQKIACVKKKLYFYRQRNGSIMSQKYEIGQMDAAEAYLERCEFFLKKDQRKWAKDAVVQGIAFLEWFDYGSGEKTKEIQNRYEEAKKQMKIHGKRLLWRPFSPIDDVVIFGYLFHILPYRLIRKLMEVKNASGQNRKE